MELFDFTSAEYQAIGLSIKVALFCSLVSLPVAIGTGWLLARKNFPRKWFVDGVVQLPLVLPPVTIGYLLIVVFGVRGFIGKFLMEHFDRKDSGR